MSNDTTIVPAKNIANTTLHATQHDVRGEQAKFRLRPVEGAAAHILKYELKAGENPADFAKNFAKLATAQIEKNPNGDIQWALFYSESQNTFYALRGPISHGVFDGLPDTMAGERLTLDGFGDAEMSFYLAPNKTDTAALVGKMILGALLLASFGAVWYKAAVLAELGAGHVFLAAVPGSLGANWLTEAYGEYQESKGQPAPGPSTTEALFPLGATVGEHGTVIHFEPTQNFGFGPDASMKTSKASGAMGPAGAQFLAAGIAPSHRKG